jgi:lysophospholipase L1-like esterase
MPSNPWCFISRNCNMKTVILIGMLGWLLVSAGCRATKSSGASEQKGLSYLALGDSYTIGESVEESERYPNQLADALRKQKVSVADPTIIARTGWTTDELRQGIANAGIAGKQYDIVTLLIGVNNEFRGQSETGYQSEFTNLLEQAIRFAGNKKERVFVLSIPDYGYTTYGKERQPEISVRIDRFNAINRRISDSLGITYIDITPISRKGISDPSLVASDGLHPSSKQYAEWVALFMKNVELKEL